MATPQSAVVRRPSGGSRLRPGEVEPTDATPGGGGAVPRPATLHRPPAHPSGGRAPPATTAAMPAAHWAPPPTIPAHSSAGPGLPNGGGGRGWHPHSRSPAAAPGGSFGGGAVSPYEGSSSTPHSGRETPQSVASATQSLASSIGFGARGSGTAGTLTPSMPDRGVLVSTPLTAHSGGDDGRFASAAMARRGTTTAAAAAAAAPAFSRVKVAVRCRPPFAEEGTAAAITVVPPHVPLTAPPPPGVTLSAVVPPGAPPVSRALHVEMQPGKKREFVYDVVFGAAATNSDVYNVIGGPIVDGVLKGVNGTVLAYGQTGSGKTHSLGILTRVTGEGGLIPRSLSHIFGAIALATTTPPHAAGDATAAGAAARQPHITYSVTMSFCQLYLDSVQDLLAPAPGVAAPGLNLASATAAGGAGAGAGGSGGGDSDSVTAGSSVATATPRHPTSRHPPSSAASASSAASSTFNDASSTHSGSTGRVMSAAARGDRDGIAAAVFNGGNLAVREDPTRGFYVEGLSEYAVRSFKEAVALLNWGLENRVLGATRMNATSSRSHTLLTVRVEARTPVRVPTSASADLRSSSSSVSGGGMPGSATAFTTRRSQLMLCDLAGSERVRRTSSRGARLEEARAINASLHTLGQVIAALSQASSSAAGANALNPHPARVHVPWRDSKLTRLLYGNLGGASNTFLLATVGPSWRNVSESVSTLLFASRCMRVSAQPVVASSAGNYSNADYAELCARLQSRLSSIESSHAVEMAALEQRYQAAMREMESSMEAVLQATASSASPSHSELEDGASPTLDGRVRRPRRIAGIDDGTGGGGGPADWSWLADATEGGGADAELPWLAAALAGDRGDGVTVVSQLLALVYRQLIVTHDAALAALLSAFYRAGRHARSWRAALAAARAEEQAAADATAAMQAHDPLWLALQAAADMARRASGERGAAVALDDAHIKLPSSLLAGVTVPGVASVGSYLHHPDRYGPHLGANHKTTAAALAAVHMAHVSNHSAPQLWVHPVPSSSGGTRLGVSGESAAPVASTSAAAGELDAVAIAGAALLTSSGSVAHTASIQLPQAQSATIGALPLSAPGAAGVMAGASSLARVAAATAGAAAADGTAGHDAAATVAAPTPMPPIALLSPPAIPPGAVLSHCAVAVVQGDVDDDSEVGAASRTGAPSPSRRSFAPHIVLASLAAALAGASIPASGPADFAAPSRIATPSSSLPSSPTPVSDSGTAGLRTAAAGSAAPGFRAGGAASATAGSSLDSRLWPLAAHPPLTTFRTAAAAFAYCCSLVSATLHNVARVNALLAIKDGRYDEVKAHLATAEAALRTRDEDAANQRYVLRYLVDTTSTLRDDVRRLRHALAAAPGGLGVDADDALHSSGSVGGMSMPASLSHSLASSRVPSPFASPIATREPAPLGEPGPALTVRIVQPQPRLGSEAAALATFGVEVQPSAAGIAASTAAGDGGAARRRPLHSAAVATGAAAPATQPSGMAGGNAAAAADAPASFAPSRTFEREGAMLGLDRAADVAAAVTPLTVVADDVDWGVTSPAPVRAVARIAQPAAAAAAATPRSTSATGTSAAAAPVAAAALPAAPSAAAARGGGGSSDRDSGDGEEEEADAADEAYDDFPVAGDDDDVEYIVSHRVLAVAGEADGAPVTRVLYQVHWRGSLPSEDEWFDRSDLLADFPRAVAEYEAKLRRGGSMPVSAGR